MILNCIEAVAWPAVVAFTVQGILKKCTGTTCVLSWIIVPLAVTMRFVALLPWTPFVFVTPTISLLLDLMKEKGRGGGIQ